MRAVLQRVSRARVIVGEEVTGRIEAGMVALVAIGRDDTAATAAALAENIVNLRIFNDENGKMNRSLLEAAGAVLAVSQFTLYGDVRGQRRPSFVQAAPPEKARELYDAFVRALSGLGVKVETGVFQAHMSLDLVNDGPVTLLVDTDKAF